VLVGSVSSGSTVTVPNPPEEPTQPCQRSRSVLRLVIIGGHVVDPANDVDRVTDVAIRDGRIAAIGDGLTHRPSRTIDASGQIVTPGGRPAHHVYWGVTYWGIEADPVAASPASPRGSSRQFRRLHGSGFREYIAEPAALRLALLNLSSIVGRADVGAFRNPTISTSTSPPACRAHRDLILGIKAASTGTPRGGARYPADAEGARAGDRVGLPLMTHISTSPPSIHEVADVPAARRHPHHCFTGRGHGIIGRTGKVDPQIKA